MSMGGGGGDTTTVQKSDPWAGIQPYLIDLYGRGSRLSDNTMQYYPGQTYANLNPYQTGAMSGMLGYAGMSPGALPSSGYNPVQLYNYDQGQNPTGTPATGEAALSPNMSTSGMFGAGAVADSLRNLLPPGEAATPATGGVVPAGAAAGATPSGVTIDGATGNVIGASPYTYGMNLPQMNVASQNAWAGQLNPGMTPAQMAGGALTPGTTQTLSRMMQGAGIAGPVAAPGVDTSGIPYSTLNTMMSGQVDTGVYNQLADTMTGRMTRNFTENILPNIRDEAIMSGGYGSSRQDLATEGALDVFSQNLGDSLSNLYGGAYNTAMQQRATGAGLATNAGVNVGTSNANLFMQAQQLAQQGRTAEADAMLRSAGLSSDLLTQAGAQSIDQGGNATKALALAPSIAQMGQMPYDIMSQVGSQLQGQDQLAISEAMNRYNYNQQAPWQTLGNFSNILAGVPVGQYGMTTGTADTSTNKGAALAGSAALGYGMYSAGMNPYAAGTLALLSYMNS